MRWRFTNLTRATEIGANSYLIEIGPHRLLLDAGLHPRAEGTAALPDLDLLPDDSLATVILSHAHHDHLGSAPVVLRRHSEATLFSTAATRELGVIMLHNSVSVMHRRHRRGDPESTPLFSRREVGQTMRRWRSAPLRTPFNLAGERIATPGRNEVAVEFHDAGHILGAAGVSLRAGGRTLFYTGDVNFADQTIARGARFPTEGVDVLVLETTRGDHPTPPHYRRDDEVRRLAAAIEATFAKGGSVLIPVFALGKCQEMLATIDRMTRRGWLKPLPVYIGGLAARITEVYDRLARETPRLQPDLRLLDALEPFVVGGDEVAALPLRPHRIHALSSGMMTEKTGSNIFARRLLGDPKHAILFVGYADPESPAGRLRATPVGTPLALDPAAPGGELLCDVQTFQFSGHASRESLRDYARQLRPRTVILVHGDPPAIAWFQETLARDLPGSRIVVPPPGAPLDLG